LLKVVTASKNFLKSFE